MADRLGENGAIKFAQESTAAVGTVSRLGGAGQIEADILKIKSENLYKSKVSNLTVRGRLINKAMESDFAVSNLELENGFNLLQEDGFLILLEQ
jgi:hypothetical protein